MLLYLAKRIVAMLVTLLGITLVTFVIIQAAPGDPVAASLGGEKGPGDVSGDASARDRKEDAIRTKKKLLGMLVEDHSVGVWSTAKPTAGDAGPADTSKAPPTLERAGSVGEFGHWAVSLAASREPPLLFAGTVGKEIHVLSLPGGDAVRTISGHRGEVWALAVSPDGATLASGDSEGGVRFHAVADGRELGAAEPLGKSVRSLVFLGAARVASACDDGVVRIQEVPSGRLVSVLKDHTSFVGAVEASKDGTRLWSAGADRKVREWDLTSGKVLRTIGMAGAPVRDLAISPDGSRLAASCDDRRVYVFSASDTAAAPLVLEGHSKGVNAVAWSADGEAIFSGGKDETIRRWSAADGRTLEATPLKTGEVTALCLVPSGESLCSASQSWTKVPAWRQYLTWLSRVARFDFDRSFVDDQRVIDKIGDAIPITLGLNAVALFLIYAISIPLGVQSAVRRGSFFDRGSSLVLFLLYSAPSFWVATLLIMTFSSERNLNLFDCVGLHSVNHADLAYLPWLKDWGSHLVLPVVTLTYAGFASLSRYTRTTMLETIAQDYIRTARAKGLPERTVIYRHALRNSLITIITLVASLLPAMIGGSVIIESIFSIQGMGQLSFQAILDRDYPVIMATTTISALLTLLGVLVSDILYVVVDPRISHE